MEPALVRTSVSVDEAVAMLLGWLNGPVLFQFVHDDPSPEEEDVRDSLLFSMADELEIMRDECESELAQAQMDGCSALVIADKRAATQKHAALAGKAMVYQCAIQDEINKGQHSALRVDAKLSSTVNTYITLTSLDAWAIERFGTPLLPATPKLETSTGKSQAPAKQVRRKMREQEEAILREIRKLEIDPQRMPKNAAGKPGIKASVRKALLGDAMFDGKTSFDKAWERLQSDGSIGYVT